MFFHPKLYNWLLCVTVYHYGCFVLVECSSRSRNLKNNYALWYILWKLNIGYCEQQRGNSRVIGFREIIFKEMDLSKRGQCSGSVGKRARGNENVLGAGLAHICRPCEGYFFDRKSCRISSSVLTFDHVLRAYLCI